MSSFMRRLVSLLLLPILLDFFPIFTSASPAPSPAPTTPKVFQSRSVRQAAANVNDTQILQFALALEYVENVFYNGYLDKFDDAAFAQAGYPPWVRKRFMQLVEHENTHVVFLKGVLGADAPLPCEYQYPVTTPQEFVTLAGVFEGGATAAYLGYANLLQDPDHITSAGSIVITECVCPSVSSLPLFSRFPSPSVIIIGIKEALLISHPIRSRHAAWIQSAVEKGAAWSTSFGTPLSLNNVYTLLSTFVVSCPSSNPVLPFRIFPQLAISPASPLPGSSISLAFNATAASNTGNSSTDAQQFLAIFSGLDTTFVPISTSTSTSADGNTTIVNTALIPDTLQGTAYAVVTNSDALPVTDATTLTGPAIFIFPLPSDAINSQ
ncbi:hypothetical protein EW146_g3313 [Bondarzewia mesenterica]|uniref:Uncharacterized protein n=1 Tax=Bondarzewia mesenterica TaxID=1095465 RepID=A0A4S4LYD1_9AGAM|nr:hypothetical protein EW146_g3313 [Bondarzewia mesenterica]